MGKRIYVGNLSYNTTEGALRTLFAEYGEIESVSMITDRDTGRPKGFAFVEMATEQAAQAAISALNGKSVDDREIKVNEAKPQADARRAALAAIAGLGGRHVLCGRRAGLTGPAALAGASTSCSADRMPPVRAALFRLRSSTGRRSEMHG